MTENRVVRRNDPKHDPLQPRRFGELRREFLENGTQAYRDVEAIVRSLMQL